MNQVMALTEDQKIVHDKLLTHLLRVRDEYIQWNEEMYQTGLAISKVNGAILTSISSDYASQLPVLESAVKQLTDDLYSLKKANEVIAAISSVLGVITTIVSLLG
jgi:hypothetical protein